MPLTPEEQQELAGLHQKFGQQPASAPATGGGLSPTEQQEFAQLHAKFGGQSPQATEPPQSLLDRAGSLAKSAMGASNAFDHGLFQAGTLGYGDDALKKAAGMAGKGDDAAQFLKQTDEEHPYARAAGDVGGAIGMGGIGGAGIGAATKALGLASPAASALGAVGKAAGRIGLNTAAGATQGFVTNPQDGQTHTGNALTGGVLAGGLSTLGELVGAATAPARRIKESMTAQRDPEAFAQLARGRIGDARQGLLDSEKGNAGKLEDLLRGKDIPIQGTTMEGNDLNALKKSYDAQARRPAGAIWSTGEAAKAADAGAQANQARAAIEAAVPEAQGINSDMQRELKLRSWLKKAGDRAPIQTLTSSSPDKQALLSEAARRGGTDLSQFSSDARTAKALTFGPSDFNHVGLGTLGKAAARTGLEGAAKADIPAQLMKDPTALSALLEYIQAKK